MMLFRRKRAEPPDRRPHPDPRVEAELQRIVSLRRTVARREETATTAAKEAAEADRQSRRISATISQPAQPQVYLWLRAHLEAGFWPVRASLDVAERPHPAALHSPDRLAFAGPSSAPLNLGLDQLLDPVVHCRGHHGGDREERRVGQPHLPHDRGGRDRRRRRRPDRAA